MRSERAPNSGISSSDTATEIMLAAFEEWGVQKSVERFVGMFAFAVLDRKERRLFLVRDRLGEKPLYYGWMNDVFLFASEIRALLSTGLVSRELDPVALDSVALKRVESPAGMAIDEDLSELDIIPQPLSVTSAATDPESAEARRVRRRVVVMVFSRKWL